MNSTNRIRIAVRASGAAAALAAASVALAVPAQAQLEVPQDGTSPVPAISTPLAGRSGVHVQGGWLLR